MSDYLPAFIADAELNELRCATTRAQWDAIVATMKEVRLGFLPPDYQVKVVASGLEFAKQQQFDGVTPLEKLTDPEQLEKEANGLLIMEEDLFKAMLAIQTAVSIRAAHMCILAISEKDGYVCDMVVEKDGKQQNQRSVGKSHFFAFIDAGRQCHIQLVLLHQKTGKLQDYIDRVAKIDQMQRFKNPVRKIIRPSSN